VTGHTRSGKTDFIATLFETLQVSKVQLDEGNEGRPLFPLDIAAPTPCLGTIECAPNGHKINLRIIDTPGLSIPSEIHRAPPSSKEALERAAANWLGTMLFYIETQFASTLEQETKVKRTKNIVDTHVHAVLYLLTPDLILANKGLTLMDKIALQGLCQKANVIPCLAKSDLVTVREHRLIKDYLHKDFAELELQLYDFAEDAGSQVSASSGPSLRAALPFCLINSEELVRQEGQDRQMGVMVGEKRILGREFIWGVVDVENETQCDFLQLKSILFDSHLDDLKEATSDCFYEQWRTQALQAQRKSVFVPPDLKKLVVEE
ncbi:hypothetical protein HDU91_002578, partial [Kappamyces sp. JEL0680]